MIGRGWAVAAFLLGTSSLVAQDGADAEFDSVASEWAAKLEQATEELSALRAQIDKERDPLNAGLRELEAELAEARAEYEIVRTDLDKTTRELSNLAGTIERYQANTDAAKRSLTDYFRNVEASLHIAEAQRFEESFREARDAAQNRNLSVSEVLEAQLRTMDRTFERLDEVLGGDCFTGAAVGPDGSVVTGGFALLGPTAVFASDDGQTVGVVERKLNSSEPHIVPFTEEANETAATEIVTSGKGPYPLDPSLGDALKLQQAEESLLEHIMSGGALMVPIITMAALAFLVAILKWISLSAVGKPSRKKIRLMLDAVARREPEEAQRIAASMRGPGGRMLEAGTQNLGESRELIEEVMYERLLTAKLSLNKWLPFVAVCAASAPLLGLLGTVTGIIETFAMIEVHGSSDIKSISGGISKALITTEFGLIVAIPSLLIHAFLSRKAKGIVGRMETSAIELTNEVLRNPMGRSAAAMASTDMLSAAAAPDPDLVKQQVNEILQDLLSPALGDAMAGLGPRPLHVD